LRELPLLIELIFDTGLTFVLELVADRIMLRITNSIAFVR